MLRRWIEQGGWEFETSVRPKQEFSHSAETEYSAAENHRIFGFGRIFGTFPNFWPKVSNLYHISRLRNKFLGHYYWHLTRLAGLSGIWLHILNRTECWMVFLTIFLEFFVKKSLKYTIFTFGFGCPCEYSVLAEYSADTFSRNHLRSEIVETNHLTVAAFLRAIIAYFNSTLMYRHWIAYVQYRKGPWHKR
jgi:hypothetical protein